MTSLVESRTAELELKKSDCENSFFTAAIQLVSSTTRSSIRDVPPCTLMVSKLQNGLGTQSVKNGGTGTSSGATQSKGRWSELVEWLDYEWEDIRNYFEAAITDHCSSRTEDLEVQESLNTLWSKVFQPHFSALAMESALAVEAAAKEESAAKVTFLAHIGHARAMKIAAEKASHARRSSLLEESICAESAAHVAKTTWEEKVANFENIRNNKKAGRGRRLLLKKWPLKEGQRESAEAAPCTIRLHGQSIQIYSVHCALAAAFTLLLPLRTSAADPLMYQYCLVLLLGKWSSKLHSRAGTGHPTVVCVMRGMREGREVWVCGTTKNVPKAGGEAKTGWPRKPEDDQTPDRWPTEWSNLLKEWRAQRSKFIDDRIGDHPYKGDSYGPNGDGPTIIARLEHLESGRDIPELDANVAGTNGTIDVTSRRINHIAILEKCLERLSLGRKQDNPPRQTLRVRTQIGDCAESWGIGVMAAVGCTGDIISIAMGQSNLGLVKSKDFKSPAVTTEHELILPKHAKARIGCNNCQYLFAVLHVNKSAHVKDDLMINGQPMEKLAIVEGSDGCG